MLGCDGCRHFVQFLEGSIQVLVEPLHFLLPIELQYFPGLGTEYDFGAGTLWRLNMAGIGLLSKKNTRDHGRSERRGTHRLRNWYLNIEQGNNLHQQILKILIFTICYYSVLILLFVTILYFSYSFNYLSESNSQNS